jgi:zinc protease
LSDPDRYALELGNHVLGGGFSTTRLYHDLRAGSRVGLFRRLLIHLWRDPQHLQSSYGCDPPNVGKARAMIVSNLKAMQEKDVTPEELHQAKGCCCGKSRFLNPASSASRKACSTVRRTICRWTSRCEAARHYYDLTAPEVRAPLPNGFALTGWAR